MWECIEITPDQTVVVSTLTFPLRGGMYRNIHYRQVNQSYNRKFPMLGNVLKCLIIKLSLIASNVSPTGECIEIRMCHTL